MNCKDKFIYFSLPLKIILGKKNYYINLNSYRNWHYQVSNRIKKEYLEIVRDQAGDLPPINSKIDLVFVAYYKDKRRHDRSNILSITEKFFCDSLVECGLIPDDNDTVIDSSQYFTGGIDKNDPRVEAFIFFRA